MHRSWFAIPLALFVVAAAIVLHMQPRTGNTEPADPQVQRNVETHVRALAGGPRNDGYPNRYAAATAYIESAMSDLGYTVEREAVPYAPNLSADLAGDPTIVLLGAHYDSCMQAPGADDNASGVAAVLEVARLLRTQKLVHTVRFVFWANEEPPHWLTDDEGSRTAARNARARGDKLQAVLALDSVGYFDDRRGSQSWPLGFGLVFPSQGNFINVVSNLSSARQVLRVAELLRRHSSVPTAYAAVPGAIPGISWSNHASYWDQGYDAVMITDMPPFRNPNYHNWSDRPETLDYDRLARFTAGLAGTVAELAAEPPR